MGRDPALDRPGAEPFGKRRGHGKVPFTPHNLVYSVIGAGLLWGGWFGFNAGSALAADGRAGLALLVTNRGLRLPFATRRRPIDWLGILFLGFVGYYLSSLLDFLGLAYISAGLERLILFLYPTVVVLISVYMFGKSITKRALFAMALSYVGIGIAFLHDIEVTGDHRATAIGGGLIFLCMITYAIYLVGSGQMTQRMGSMQFAGLATSVAAIACMIHFLIASPLVAGTAIACATLPMPRVAAFAVPAAPNLAHVVLFAAALVAVRR